MSGNGQDPAFVATVVLTAVVLALVFYISRTIGADFQSTLAAFMPSLVIVFLAGLGKWKLDLPLIPLAAFSAVLIWPFWWRVIDSIANAGSSPDQFQLHLGEDPFWATTTFKWVIEFLLASMCGALIYRHKQNSY